MTDKWQPNTLVYTGHALRQMFARQIDTAAIQAVVRTGETAADYPDDQPYPSRLRCIGLNLLKTHGSRHTNAKAPRADEESPDGTTTSSSNSSPDSRMPLPWGAE